MNGNLLIDTNIVLYLFDGDKSIAEFINNRDIYISFISELELLGFKNLNNKEKTIIKEFLNNCIIVDINQNIKVITIELRQNYKIKLPDAIIAATSYYLNMPFFSADKEFEKIEELQFIKYEV